MADDIVRTVIEAVDNATPVINQVGSSYEKLALDTEKANATMSRSASDTERSFASLAQSLNSGTNTAAAQASIGALNDMLARGEISADTYGAAILQVGQDSGLMSAKSIDAADQMTTLNQQLASGKITADQYADGVKKVQTELTTAAPAAAEMTNESNNLTSTLMSIGVVAGGVVGAIGALKVVFDFSREGAQINRIQEQFSAAMSTMGIDAEALMTRMQAAVRGTVDDEALAQVATRAFTQGIVSSSDMMVRMLELARAKSVLLGQDTQAVFETIVQSTDMLSERGFKRLGINLDPLTKLVADYAAQHGVAASSIDTETQKTILLSAALDKSKDAINRANAAGDDQLTKIQRLETGWSEFWDSVKSFAANVVIGTVDNFNTLTSGNDRLTQVFVAHAKQVENTATTYKDYEAEILRSGLLTGDFDLVMDGTTKNLVKQRAAAGEATYGYVILNDEVYFTSNNYKVLTAAMFDAERGAYGIGGALDESTRAAQRAVERMRELDNGMRDNGLSALTATNAIGGLAGAYQQAAKEASTALAILNSEIAGAVGNEIDNYTKKNTDLHDKLSKVKDELQKLQAAQGSPIQNKHILSTAELTAAQAKLAVITEDLTNKTRKAGESDAEYNSRIANLQVQQENLTAKIQTGSEAVTGYVDNSKKIGELKATYDDLTGQIDAAANAHDLATKKILFNIASQQAAAIVAQDPSKAAIFASALNEVALKYGIIDQATKTATDNIIAANNKLATDGNLPAYLAQLGMVATVSGQTAEQVAASDASVSAAHSAMVSAMGAPIVIKADTKPLSDFQQHLQDKKPFDDYKAKLTDSVTKSTTAATAIKTNISEIITQQALMANDPSINAYAVNVGAMTDTAHGYYQGLRADINETIARQIALNNALANGTAAGYTGNTPSSSSGTRTNPLGEHRALGGPIAPMRSYLVGENGPERLDMYANGGYVTPLSGGQGKQGGPAQVNNVTINDPLSSAIWLTYIYGQNRMAADARM